jgi:hypothetical protein
VIVVVLRVESAVILNFALVDDNDRKIKAVNAFHLQLVAADNAEKYQQLMALFYVLFEGTLHFVMCALPFHSYPV